MMSGEERRKVEDENEDEDEDKMFVKWTGGDR
jgi:hypothetical protein